MKKAISFLFILGSFFSCKKSESIPEPESYSSNYNIVTYEVECDSCIYGDFFMKEISDYANNEWFELEICHNHTHCPKFYTFSANKKFSKTLAIPKDSSIRASINVFYNAYPFTKKVTANVRIKLNNNIVAERVASKLDPFIKVEYSN